MTARTMTAVDLFAGAGGFTLGATRAGLDIVYAANHLQLAVDVHAANHVGAQHVCQDLQQADFTLVPGHDVLLASPSCVGHTKARGKDAKHHDAARATAWAVVSCAEVHRPQVIVVENVTEMQAWELYPVWAQALFTLGYSLTTQVLDSADFGVPQHRVRLYQVFTLGRTPLELPTHEALPHVAVSSVLDFDDLGGPVYRPGRATATISRHEAGRRNVGERFLAPFYGRGSGTTGRRLDRPCGTLTTKARWALHQGDRMRMLTTGETLAIGGFPAGYIPSGVSWTNANHLIGNACTPAVVEWLLGAIKESI